MNIYHFSSNHIQDVKKTFVQLMVSHYSNNEAEVIFKRLLEHLGMNPFDKNVLFNQSELILLSEYIDLLKQDAPLEYVLGYAYFFNLKFFVNQNVLIPRPETEEMVYYLKEIISKNYANQKHLKILDIGTGSGCIAITLSKMFSDAVVHAVDVSEKAIEVAQRNAEYHQVNVEFYLLDILKNAPEVSYDIIVSNPPYIPLNDAQEIANRVKNFEPSIALFSQTPLQFYERIFDLSKTHLNENGLIFLELNQYYSKDILELTKQYEYIQNAEIIKDWSGNDRFIKCNKKSNNK